MKIIHPNNITSITADEEAAGYPATNLQTDYVKEKWKATSGHAVITVNVSSGGAVALFGTNADQGTVSISSILGVFWESGWSYESGWSWATTPASTPTTLFNVSNNVGTMWTDYGNTSVPHTITITLINNAGTTLEAGVVHAGTLNTFEEPIYGLKEGLVDYSIKKELNNGAWYIRKRDVVRRFDFNLFMVRNSSYLYNFFDIIKSAGPNPVAWNIYSEDTSDSHWIVFGGVPTTPSATHILVSESELSISIVEFV